MIRPDYQKFNSYIPDNQKIAWKTGTSHNRLDFWSIAYTDDYTVVVWLGNFNNKSAANKSAYQVASPLLFNIFKVLGSSSNDNKVNLVKRKVCTVTGLIPGEHCDNKIDDYHLPFVSSTKTCEHIKEVYISEDEETIYCVECLPDDGFKKILLTDPDPNYSMFLSDENVFIENHPKHYKYCERKKKGFKPRITSPTSNLSYMLEENDRIMLKAIASMDVDSLSWFINDELVAQNHKDSSIFISNLSEGQKNIVCMDQQGRYSRIGIKVVAGNNR